MIQSMTGFGSSEVGGIKTEIRSLNHRFMEVNFKCPPALIRHEMTLRDMLKSRFGRGKFDVYISMDPAQSKKIRVNMQSVRAVFDSLCDMKKDMSLNGDVDLNSLVQWKEFFVEEDASYDIEDLYTSFREAVSGLDNMRKTEGKTLADETEKRLAEIHTINAEIASMLPSLLEESRRKYDERLRMLLIPSDRQIDECRVVMEASSIAQKMDISEEISRINSHIEHAHKTIEEASGTDSLAGKRLDFLMQELNREANTIASKSDSSSSGGLIVRMKVEIERAREQVQNIQ